MGLFTSQLHDARNLNIACASCLKHSRFLPDCRPFLVVTAVAIGYGATRSSRFVYFQWESAIPASFHDSPIHVDRPSSSSRRRSLANGRGVADLFAAGRAAILLPAFAFAFPRVLLPAPSCQRMVGASLMVSRKDSPLNSPSLHRDAVAPVISTREISRCYLVARALSFSAVFRRCSLPAPRYRHRRWFCPGGLLLPLSRAFARLPVVVNRRIGSYYAAGARSSCSRARSSAMGVLLLCPRSRRYRGNRVLRSGSVIFTRRKESGVEHAVVLAPFCSVIFSLLYYRSRCRSRDEVTPRIWIGGKTGARFANEACAPDGRCARLSAEFLKRNRSQIIIENIRLDLLLPPRRARGDGESSASFPNGAVYGHCKTVTREVRPVALIYNEWESEHRGEAFAIVGGLTVRFSTRGDLRLVRIRPRLRFSPVVPFILSRVGMASK